MVVPLSELSSTSMEPPWSAAISQTSASPSPTPPYALLRDLSTRKKGWKMLVWYCSGMPGPWSRTRSSTRSPSAQALICTVELGAL